MKVMKVGELKERIINEKAARHLVGVRQIILISIGILVILKL